MRQNSAFAALRIVAAVIALCGWKTVGHTSSVSAAASSSGDEARIQQQQPPRKTPVKKILYIEGAPRPETKFIRRAISDVPSLRLVTLQRVSDGKYLRFDVEESDDLRDGFPATREELFRYDAVLLGSVEATLFSSQQHAMLADFVSTRGGILALGGPQSFGEGGWLDTPLSYLLPIAFDPNSGPKSPAVALKVTVHPTEAASSYAALQTGGDQLPASDVWERLPALTMMNAVQARPGAEILMEGRDRSGRQQVVLAVQMHGAGKAIVFAPVDSWVWAMQVDSLAHERFWRHLLEWLVTR